MTVVLINLKGSKVAAVVALPIRDLTQQDDWKTQDGRMTKKMSRKTGNAQSRTTLFRHSTIWTPLAVLLRKVSIVKFVTQITAL